MLTSDLYYFGLFHYSRVSMLNEPTSMARKKIVWHCFCSNEYMKEHARSRQNFDNQKGFI